MEHRAKPCDNPPQFPGLTPFRKQKVIRASPTAPDFRARQSPLNRGKLVRVVGLEPTLLAERVFETLASTIPPHPRLAALLPHARGGLNGAFIAKAAPR